MCWRGHRACPPAPPPWGHTVTPALDPLDPLTRLRAAGGRALERIYLAAALAEPRHRKRSIMADTDDATVSKLPANDVDFDFDAYLEQKAEATGRPADLGSFRHKGREWTFTHPSYASDEWSDRLEELEGDDESQVRDLAEHYLGSEQFDQYLTAGGTAMTAVTAVGRAVQAEQRAGSRNGRPTRRSRSSAKRRKR